MLRLWIQLITNSIGENKNLLGYCVIEKNKYLCSSKIKTV